MTTDPTDVEEGRIAQELPGIRWFLDYDRHLSLRYGAATPDEERGTNTPHRLLLDPMLRVRGRVSLSNGMALIDELRQHLSQHEEAAAAPVLAVPGVIPPELCRALPEK